MYGKDYVETKEKLSRARLGLVCHDTEKSEVGCINRKNAAGICGRILFSQAAAEWLAEISGRRKYSTYIKYDTIYRTHLAGTVGSCRLSPDTVQEVRKRFLTTYRREGYLRVCRKVLSALPIRSLLLPMGIILSGYLCWKDLRQKQSQKHQEHFLWRNRQDSLPVPME